MVEAEGLPGDILDVDWTVQNAGDTGEQVIELIRLDTGEVVDSVQVELVGGQSRSEVLSWLTPDDIAEDRYSMRIRSANDDISFGVGIGDFIPDSVVTNWPVNSEDTANTVFDAVGDADMTLNGPSVEEDSDAWEGHVLLFDASADDSAEAPHRSTIDIETDFALIFTIEFVGGFTAGDDFGQVMRKSTESDQTTSPANYNYSILSRDGDSQLQFELIGSGEEEVEVSIPYSSLSIDTKHRICWTWDGTTDTGAMKVYLDGTEEDSASPSFTIANTDSDWDLSINQRATDRSEWHLNMELDNLEYRDEHATESDVDDDFGRQPWSGSGN